MRAKSSYKPQNRTRPLVALSLSPEAVERADEMATRRGISRSALVEALIRETPMPHPLRPVG